MNFALSHLDLGVAWHDLPYALRQTLWPAARSMSRMKRTTETPMPIRSGQTFKDRDGLRWSVKGRRPGSDNQFVIEAEMKGSYPRVAVYVMSEREFRAQARKGELKAEKPNPRKG